VIAGPMCELCASGFFLRPDRTCSKCPEASGYSSTLERLGAALPFAAGIIVTLMILTVILAKLQRMSGEDNARTVWMEVSAQWIHSPTHHCRILAHCLPNRTAAQAMAHSREFCIWLVLSAQFLATATSSIAAGLPDWLFQLLRIVSLFNASPSYTSYEGCDGDYRFQAPLGIFVGAWLLVVAMLVAIYAIHHGVNVVWFAGFIFVTINALYSVIVQQCLKFLDCSASPEGGFIFTGGAASASVKILPDGTMLTEAVFMPYASRPRLASHIPVLCNCGKNLSRVDHSAWQVLVRRASAAGAACCRFSDRRRHRFSFLRSNRLAARFSQCGLRRGRRIRDS
jgi:hypothetical protein